MSKYRTHEPQRPDGPLCNGKITHVTGARAWSEAAKVNRPDAVRYSAEADARSWASMEELFGETLY